MKNSQIKKVVVTGGAGNIAYSLLFRLAAGDLFGKDKKISLSILEKEEMLPILKGVVMELEDCASPLLAEIRYGADSKEIFDNAEYVFLVGAKPRGPGMERRDLLIDNARLFKEQGSALDAVAHPNVLTLVIGNPCNTNCLIAQACAKRIAKERFFAMTRLDQNRARALIAKRAGVPVTTISPIVIWGNHSSTQVPDIWHATIEGEPLRDRLPRAWLETDFFSLVQERGTKIIEARGKSSAASAAQAAIDAMRSLIFPGNELFSMGVLSTGNPYGIQEGLVFSFPCISEGEGQIRVAPSLEIPPLLRKKLSDTEQELDEERRAVQELL
ncbi:MAG: malate dehydrogenase [Chlamydiae bacterium]|nr:malate dehydrogenase [Chlamydiota bacterium]